MRTSKYTEAQKVVLRGALRRQVDAGTPVVEVCRKLGGSEATVFRWRKQIGDLGTTELKELRQLRDEVRRLGLAAGQALVADLSLDQRIPQESTKRKWWGRRCGASGYAGWARRTSAARGGRVAPRTAARRRGPRADPLPQSPAAPDPTPRAVARARRHAAQLRRQAAARAAAWRRSRREGWPVHVKRVHRLHREEGLALRRRPPERRGRVVGARAPRAVPTGANHRWGAPSGGMDFIHGSP